MHKRIVVLSGAGISAESGLSTFRGQGGLWEGHDIMEVASPDGWYKNPALVLEFYNARRRQLLEVVPNAAHEYFADLENQIPTTIITQNVDDLHERAGSSDVLHLHGELRKVRSSKNPELIYSWDHDLTLNDKCKLGSQLRPHIVWFGEEVPMLNIAIEIVRKADALIVVGTSLQVYPAASLLHFTNPQTPVFYIDPYPNLPGEFVIYKQLQIIEETAVTGVQVLSEKLEELGLIK